MKINVQSIRVCLQYKLSGDEYTESLVQKLLELDELKLDVLYKLQVQKRRITKSYNKKVIAKSFNLGELVWETVLPLYNKDPKYGKWSPNWKEPYKVNNVLPNRAYHLEGTKHMRFINDKYLKKYVPSLWESEQIKT